MRTFLIILCFAFIQLSLAHAGMPGNQRPDSARYKWVKGEKFLLHKVQPQETWNSISRKYNVSITELMKANLGVIDLKTGQILNIPTTRSKSLNNDDMTTGSVTPVNDDSKYKSAILYLVQSGETLFSIAKKFSSSVEEIKKWNNLENNIVREGQKLIVSYGYTYSKQEVNPKPEIGEALPPLISETKSGETYKTAVESKPIATDQKSPVEKPDDKGMIANNSGSNNEIKISSESKNLVDLKDNPTRSMIPVGKGSSGKTLMQVTESGVCSWISDSEVNQNKFYALHRTAPIGTIVKVTNKMNDRYVFVKVVGILPDTGDNQNSIIKISQAAVNKLGALDAHFQVSLSFGMLQ